MRIEIMIYIYGAVCVSMIGFNVAYAILLRSSQPRLEKRTRRLTQAIQAQLARLEQGQPVSSRHLARLRRRLLQVKNLTAFDLALRPMVQKDPRISDYLAQLQPAILYLAVVYRKRENVQAAYFSYGMCFPNTCLFSHCRRSCWSTWRKTTCIAASTPSRLCVLSAVLSTLLPP